MKDFQNHPGFIYPKQLTSLVRVRFASPLEFWGKLSLYKIGSGSSFRQYFVLQ